MHYITQRRALDIPIVYPDSPDYEAAEAAALNCTREVIVEDHDPEDTGLVDEDGFAILRTTDEREPIGFDLTPRYEDPEILEDDEDEE